jgi:cytochrome c biogenesis protein CcdA/DsbC/DsbD-like thiol-disulfide interchange protein
MTALLALAVLLGAQDLPGAKPRKEKPAVKVLAVRPEKDQVLAGDAVRVWFDLEIPKTWHIYPAGKKPLFGTPTVFTFEEAEVAGKIEEPAPKLKKEEGVGDVDYHEEKITITVPVRLRAEGGAVDVKGKISYQICDPNVCVDNSTPFAFKMTVLAVHRAATPRVTIQSIQTAPSEAKVGEVVKAAFELKIPNGWHIYPAGKKPLFGTPTEFTFENAEVAGKIEEPAPKLKKENGVGEIDYHEGTITVTVPLRLKADVKPGVVDVKGKLRYQICDPSTCVNETTPLLFPMTVREGAVASTAQNAATEAATKELQKEGLVGFFLLAIGGGLLSLIMPCVYPLIPITITYFVKQGAGSRAKSLLLSGAYAIGIIIVFTLVGFLFSLLLGASGARQFAREPVVNIGVAGLFFWFAFSLFGLYEITLPSALTGSLTGKQRSGVGGAFILGGLFSVVTFTCTIPIAATILAVAASSAAEQRFIGLLAMLVYSVTMALPFFLLGLFPALLTGVRKGSGDWLHTVKVTAGFAELALALFYLAKADQVSGWGVLTRPVMISVWVAVLVVMAFYLLRVFQLKGDEADPEPPAEGGAPVRRQVGVPRMLIALFFFVNAVFVGSGFAGRTLGVWDIVLPVNVEASTGNGVVATPGQKVFDNLPEAEAEARKTGKPVFVEFTGVT